MLKLLARGKDAKSVKKKKNADNVQGPLFWPPVHREDHRQGEGREAEAVSAPRLSVQGTEVDISFFVLASDV